MAGAQFLDVIMCPADGDRAGMVESMPERRRAAGDALDIDRHDRLAEQGNDRMQWPHPAQARGARGLRAPTHRLGPLKIADDGGDRLGQHIGGGPPRSVDHREPNAVAVLQLVLAPPRLAQESVERLLRRRGFRPFQFFAHRLGRGGQAAGDQREAARCRVSRDPVMAQPRQSQRFGHHPREIIARLGLHPRRDFLGQEFKEKVSTHAAYPLCVIHAAQAPLARSRTRPI